jgi:hypothetical protein
MVIAYRDRSCPVSLLRFRAPLHPTDTKDQAGLSGLDFDN